MSTTNTVEFFRNKYLDYSNQIPNEPRIKKDGNIDEIIFYPLTNTYYNIYNKELIKLPFVPTLENKQVEEKWFFERLYAQQIEYAIKFLQVESLEKYIIKNYKSLLLNNPFYQLFYVNYPIDKNIEASKQIIMILIDNYDDNYELITQITLPKKEQEYILDLLHSFLPLDPDNLCQFCLQTEPKKMLIKCCDCICKTHAKCLEKLNEYKPLKECSVCKSKYKINEPVIRTQSGIIIKPEYEKIFFPYNDLYREPLLSDTSLFKFEGMSRLTMAIIYLQVHRVKELLEEKEILDRLADYYFGYSGYKQSPIHALCTGNLYSNAHYNFSTNSQKYLIILNMLLQTKKFDISQKDAFDMTPMEYVEKYKLYPLKNLLFEYEISNRLELKISSTENNNIKLTLNHKENEYVLFNGVPKTKAYFIFEKRKLGKILYTNDKLTPLTYKRYYRSNKIAKRIFVNLDNINKLSNGKIKLYHIFNKLELEIICNYLLKKNILHTIKIKLKTSCDSIDNILYLNYKKSEDKFNHYFNNYIDDLEYNKIYNNYELYIQVYKGFVNLLEPNIKDNKITNYKFGIYIW